MTDNDLLGRIMTTDDLSRVPPMVPSVSNMLNMRSLAWLAGNPGSYKSFLAIDLACNIAAGRTYRTGPVYKAPTLYVTGEGKGGLYGRIQAWEQANRCMTVNTRWLPEAVPVTSPDWDLLVDAANTISAGFIVLDTQAWMTPGLDENSVSDMGRYVRGLSRLMEGTGACVLTIHHSSKGGESLRGSSAVHGAADTVINLDRRTDEGTQEKVVQVSCMKQKDLDTFGTYYMRPVTMGVSIVLQECERPGWWGNIKRNAA